MTHEEQKLHEPVLIRISNRHVHLRREDLELLFGEGYELTVRNYIGASKTEFAAEETVSVAGPKGVLERVRILGPCRKYTQIELMRSDCHRLGIKAPVRMSGDLDGSAPVILFTNGRAVPLPRGAIIAERHIHLDHEVAERIGVTENDTVDILVRSGRPLTFNQVAVHLNPARTDDTITLHIDMDESNAAGIADASEGSLIAIRKGGS